MITWEGIIQSGDLVMEATVFLFPRTEDSFGRWHGSGASTDNWSISQGKFSTNIGEIIITKQIHRGEEGFYYEFTGTGPPKGPLAKLFDD